MSSAQRAQNIASHHALRGIAAFLVLLFHFRDVSPAVGKALDAMTGLFSTGFIWVDFFFILSGFILSHVYGASFATPAGRNAHATRRFYVARFARIYPLHLATLAAMVLLELSAYAFKPELADAFVSDRKGLGSIAQHLTLTHSWLTMRWLEWNVPSWSISTEAFAYLMFPLLLPLTRAGSKWLRLLLPLAALAIYVHTFVNFHNIEDQQPLLRCMAGFMSGMLIFRFWQQRPDLGGTTASLLQLAALGTALAAMHLHLSQAIVIGSFALLIYATASDGGLLPRLLRLRPLLILGTLSYSMYMTHWIIYKAYWMYGANLLQDMASLYSPDKVFALKVLVLMSLTMALSVAAYFKIELPARGYFSRLFAR